VEVGCLSHPGASLVANHLLDGDHYHTLRNLGYPTMSSHTEGRKQATHCTNKTTGKRRRDRKGKTASKKSSHA